MTLASVWGFHQRPVNSPHKWPVTRKMFPFDDVIMISGNIQRIMTIVIGKIWDTKSRDDFRWFQSMAGDAVIVFEFVTGKTRISE